MLGILEHCYFFLDIKSIRDVVLASMSVGRYALSLRAREISGWLYCERCKRFFVEKLFVHCSLCRSSLRLVPFSNDYAMSSLHCYVFSCRIGVSIARITENLMLLLYLLWDSHVARVVDADVLQDAKVEYLTILKPFISLFCRYGTKRKAIDESTVETVVVEFYAWLRNDASLIRSLYDSHLHFAHLYRVPSLEAVDHEVGRLSKRDFLEAAKSSK